MTFSMRRRAFLLALAGLPVASCSQTQCGCADDTTGKDTCVPPPEFKNGHVKVAAVGDSLTFGRHASRRSNSYPSVMQRLLGSEYQVYNLGCPGSRAEMWTQGKKVSGRVEFPSYWTTDKFKLLNSSQWDIVVMMLGTNDDVAGCHGDVIGGGCNSSSTFDGDYRALVEQLMQFGRGAGQPPLVILVTPPPLAKQSCPSHGNLHAYEARRLVDGHNRIVTASMVPQIAREHALPVVDVTSSFSDGMQLDYQVARTSASCHFYCNQTESAACEAAGATRDAFRRGVCTCDHTHLSDDGYLVLAEVVSKTVQTEWARLPQSARRVRRRGERQFRSLQANSDAH